MHRSVITETDTDSVLDAVENDKRGHMKLTRIAVITRLSNEIAFILLSSFVVHCLLASACVNCQVFRKCSITLHVLVNHLCQQKQLLFLMNNLQDWSLTLLSNTVSDIQNDNMQCCLALTTTVIDLQYKLQVMLLSGFYHLYCIYTLFSQ